MSEERPIYARWRYPFANIEGKKIMIVEFFEARYWRLKHGMDVFPSPKESAEIDWKEMYRLRINGRWFGERKLSFFTMVQAAEIVQRILATGRCHDQAVIELDHVKSEKNLPITRKYRANFRFFSE